MPSMKAWLSCNSLNADSLYRLICLPHAGSSPVFFRNWAQFFPDAEVYTVCYPGRGTRIEEPFPTNLISLSHDIADVIGSLADRPIVLFGHSMGAAIGLEVARSLESKGISVAHLFASGSRNGPCPPKDPVVYEDDDTICEQLKIIGGTDVEIIDDPIFRELALPAVRADGAMFRAYMMQNEPKLICPVTTIFGDDDPHADIRPWNDIARNGFKEHIVSGDHFYLTSNPPINILHNSLKNFTHMRIL